MHGNFRQPDSIDGKFELMSVRGGTVDKGSAADLCSCSARITEADSYPVFGH
jgi:hypothetical protein